MENIANSFGGIIFIVAVIGLSILLIWFFVFKVKHLKTPDVYMVDGGVKTGKSLVTVKLAVRQYKINCLKVAIFNFFRRICNKVKKWKKKEQKALLEKPMLYANMPLYKIKYNKLTLDILKWQVRIPHKSVCLIDEATLLADSMLGMSRSKDKMKEFDETNEVLTLFLKTYGHQTHGGSCFYNSQNVVDLHFSFKRCTSTYLMITKNRKFPFFCLLDVREIVHDESGDTKNVITRDIDEDNKPLFVSKRWYKYYDRYYLDILTKHLPLLVNYDVEKIDRRNHQELKEIVTLGNYKKIKEFNEKNMPKPVIKENVNNEKECA